MTSGQRDAAFTGSIPSVYDRFLVPLLFEPYAADLAARAAAPAPGRVLETAAGTGAATQALSAALPEADIVATDLNPAMLAMAATRFDEGRVTLQPADAQHLSFEDGRFDLVVCQFGVMFFPDRAAAYREAKRVLTPGGRLLFNVWNRIDANPVTAAVAEALADLFPDNPPGFLERVPFGYFDTARIRQELIDAGFRNIVIETVEKRSRAPSARDAAIGLCQGTPLRAELEGLGEDALERATNAATAAIARLAAPDGSINAPMSAHVISAES